MSQELRQFMWLARVSGGSLRLAGYFGLLLTIAFAGVGLALIEPFRAGRISGSYWSLIVYDEVLQRWLGPISAVSVLVALGLPILGRQFSSQPRKPMPKFLKAITALLVLATIVAWGVIAVSSFRNAGYRHEDNLIRPGESFFLASKRDSSSEEGLYLIYHCNQTGFDCKQTYAQRIKPDGIYSYSVKGTPVTLNLDQPTNQLVIRFRHYGHSVYVPL